jgi:hypothetical protein
LSGIVRGKGFVRPCQVSLTGLTLVGLSDSVPFSENRTENPTMVALLLSR